MKDGYELASQEVPEFQKRPLVLCVAKTKQWHVGCGTRSNNGDRQQSLSGQPMYVMEGKERARENTNEEVRETGSEKSEGPRVCPQINRMRQKQQSANLAIKSGGALCNKRRRYAPSRGRIIAGNSEAPCTKKCCMQARLCGMSLAYYNNTSSNAESHNSRGHSPAHAGSFAKTSLHGISASHL